jgi:DNA polymerase-3 subunit epsilon
MSWDAGDRIIEIAVVDLDVRGVAVGCWTTLINPGRPVAGSEVHAVTDRDVVHAPKFSDVAGKLARSCAGRVVVAHNLAFDARFLREELDLCGFGLALNPDAGLCTLTLAEHYLPHVSGQLENYCYAAGIIVRHRHWALWDADATGRLLRYYIQSDYAFARHWCPQIEASLALPWRSLERSTDDDALPLPRCPPTAHHLADDWCATCSPPDVRRPPLPDRPRRA